MQKLPGLTGMIFFFIMDHWTISKRHIRFTCLVYLAVHVVSISDFFQTLISFAWLNSCKTYCYSAFDFTLMWLHVTMIRVELLFPTIVCSQCMRKENENDVTYCRNGCWIAMKHRCLLKMVL